MPRIMNRVSTLLAKELPLLPPTPDARGGLLLSGEPSCCICRTTRLLVLRKFESVVRVAVVCRFCGLMVSHGLMDHMRSVSVVECC